MTDEDAEYQHERGRREFVGTPDQQGDGIVDVFGDGDRFHGDS
ncbi:MAG: hypothetical protein NTX45_12640 [Proteobacteria bacterium]|nr:hypothetical protein [Pseudomonadota bacterium]